MTSNEGDSYYTEVSLLKKDCNFKECLMYFCFEMLGALLGR